MSRPTDWTSLDLPGDPVAGDTYNIRLSVIKLRKVSALITDQADKLKRLNSGEGWDSESGDAFATGSGDLAGAIEKAKGRYDGVADALATYANGLDGVQADADDILSKGNTAESDWNEANRRVLPAKDDPKYDDEKKKRDDDLRDASRRWTTAKDDIANLVDAGSTWHSINAAAAKSIASASDDDLKDHWWDDIKQAIHGARAWLNTIKDILGAIGAIVGAIMLIALLCIPGVNLAVLAIIALVIAVAALAITLAQAFAGDATAKDVALAVVDVALSIVGLKGVSLVGKLGALMSKAGKLDIAGTKSAVYFTKLQRSVSASAGWAAKSAGGDYGAAFTATWSKVADIAKSGGATEALFTADAAKFIGVIKEIGVDTGRATEFATKGLAWASPSAAIATYATYKTGEGVVDLIDHIQNGWPDPSRIQIGSL